MPLYEFTCEACQRQSELLVRSAEDEVCPHCGSRRLHKQFSVPAPPGGRSHSAALPLAGPPAGFGCGRPQCGGGQCQGMS